MSEFVDKLRSFLVSKESLPLQGCHFLSSFVEREGNISRLLIKQSLSQWNS